MKQIIQNGDSVLTIHWDIILIIIGVVLLFIAIRLIILLFLKKRLSICIKGNRYQEALMAALNLNKAMVYSVEKDTLRLYIALLYFYLGDCLNCHNYMDKISNKCVLMVKYYWMTIISIIARDDKMVTESYWNFDHSPQKGNKIFLTYGEYKQNLLLIMAYYKNPSESNKNALQNLVLNENNISQVIIARVITGEE